MSAWVAETLAATTLLMALVLAIRPLVRRLFGAGAAYALWLVPVSSLFVPTFTRTSAFPGPVAPMEVVFAAAPAEAGAFEWLVWVWGAGALFFVGRHVVGYRRFVARALIGAERLTGHGPEILLTDAVDGPAAAGLKTRRIFLPRDFETRFTASERDLALRHERMHLERGDLVANAGALLVLALHWFNPLAYLAYRAFREDQELSCDAAVIAAAGAEERAAYGAAMVKSAWGVDAPATACPMSRPKTLKRRLTMIKTHKTSRFAKVGTLASLALATVAGATLTATSGIAAEPVQTIRNITVKEVDGPEGVADALGKELNSKCGNVQDRFETTAESQQNGKPVKTMFLLCNKAGAAPTDQLKMMEGARAAIAGKTDIDAGKRAKILAALDSALAKPKAGN